MSIPPESAVDDLSPPAEFVTKFKMRLGRLHMLPEAANRALMVARDPRCTIESFTKVVGQDVKLAGDILKIANSILYSPRSPITNLHRAVVRLGFQECQNLIITSSIASMVYKVSMEQEWIRTVLWWHSLTTGLLATYMNRSFRIGFHGEEFTAGIMHDIGRTLIAVTSPEQFSSVDPLDFNETSSILEHESSILGTDHCRIGAWFARMNQLPSPLPEVILRHHQPEIPGDCGKMIALIAVADHMANHLQRCGSDDGYVPQLNPALPILKAHMPETFEPHFCEIANSLMQEVRRDAKSMIDL